MRLKKNLNGKRSWVKQRFLLSITKIGKDSLTDSDLIGMVNFCINPHDPFTRVKRMAIEKVCSFKRLLLK